MSGLDGEYFDHLLFTRVSHPRVMGMNTTTQHGAEEIQGSLLVIYTQSLRKETNTRPNRVNSRKEISFGSITGKPRNYTHNLTVTYAIFISLDVNKKHVITPAVDSDVATKPV